MSKVTMTFETLAENWMAFRAHRPVGEYLPVGQLSGDCSCGRGSWPCEDLIEAVTGTTTVLGEIGVYWTEGALKTVNSNLHEHYKTCARCGAFVNAEEVHEKWHRLVERI